MSVAKITSKDAGQWVVVGPGDSESGPYHRQRDARAAARRIVQRSGGGEVVIHSRSGRIAERQTVPAEPTASPDRSARPLSARSANGR